MSVGTYVGPETALTVRASGNGGIASVPLTRSEAEFANARRHSRLVRMLKFGLPLSALFATGFFVAATFLADSRTPSTSVESVSLTDGRIVMSKPKLEGFDAQKRPYAMTAERAVQQGTSSNIVELEQISANMPFGEAGTANLTADGGVMDSGSNRLDLKNNIRLNTSDGIKAVLSQASVNFSTNEITSNAPVDIVTAGSHITADRMKIDERGKVFVFESRVRLKIDASKMKQGSDARAEPETPLP